MAFVSNMDQDEDQKNTAQGPVSPSGGGQTVHLAPSSGVTSGAGSPTTGTPKAGGNFASLQNYVDANQGGAAPLAGQITQGVQNQYNTLQGQNTSTLNGIQGNVNSGYTAQDPSVLSQEAANPVSFASNPSNISSFQKQLNDQYTGPTSAEGDSGYQNQVANVNQAITTGQNLTGSEAGRQQLLSQFEQAPSTSVTGLNSAILSKDPTSLNSIENAYKPFSNLTTQLSTGAQGIDNSIAGAQTDAQAANSTANAQIASQSKSLQNNLNDELAQGQTNAQAYQKYATAQDTTGVNGVNSAIADFEKNLTVPGSGSQIFAPSTWNNIGTGATLPGATYTSALPTLGQVATPEQFSTANALSELAGPSYTNPLAGVTASTYNPLTTDPTISQMVAPEVAPLQKFIEAYNQGPTSGLNNPAGSQFGAGSPTAANVNPEARAVVQQQYQNLLNQLNNYYGGSPKSYSDFTSGK